MLKTLLCVCLSFVAATVQRYELCPGTSFYLPRSPDYDPNVTNLYFQGGYNKEVMILNYTRSTDSHYQFKDQTLFISRLRKTDTGTFSRFDGSVRYPLLDLFIKDCAENVLLLFGNQLKLKIPRGASQLELFSPSTTRKKVVWMRYKDPSSFSNGFIEDGFWILAKTTYADVGSYTFRTHDGFELTKTNIAMKGLVSYCYMDEESEKKLWDTVIEIPRKELTVVYHAESGERNLIVKDGKVISPGHQTYTITGTDEPEGVIFSVQNVQSSNSGNYMFFDKKSNLLALRILEVNSSHGYYIYLLALIPIALLILVIICVKKCGCKQKNSNLSSEPVSVAPMAHSSQPYSAIEMNETAQAQD